GKSYGPDGKEGNNPLRLHTDEKGKVNVRFKLPAPIERGQATLSVQFDDGGSVETLVRPIPIALKKLDIEYFPEGGDLVAGLPNRVYFQARTTLGKPAEVKGRIVDQDNSVVADDVHTLSVDDQPELNQGMGAFGFTPRSGHKYELKIDSPSGIEGKYSLPELKEDGVVLHIPKGMSSASEPIHVVVQSAGKDRSLL